MFNSSTSAEPVSGQQNLSKLRCVLLMEVVNIEQTIENLDIEKKQSLIRQLDRRMREVLVRWYGRLIDRVDATLLVFDHPAQAIGFAMDYLRTLRDISDSNSLLLQARFGLHVGDVLIIKSTAEQISDGLGTDTIDIEEATRLITYQLMSIALPGQILVSEFGKVLAQPRLDQLGETAEHLRWMLHGAYRFASTGTSMTIYEVGDQAFSPLKAPPASNRAWPEQSLLKKPMSLIIGSLAAVAILIGLVSHWRDNSSSFEFQARDRIVLADLQNLTAAGQLTPVIESALRIGLEQSPHFNLIDSGKIDQIKQRMLRSQAPVDKQLGAEIAQRESAKALIFPTLSETNGGLQISIEVLDPDTMKIVIDDQLGNLSTTTLLPALDTLIKNLRRTFGESDQSITQLSEPLTRIASANIEALADYALAQRAIDQRQFPVAIDYLQNALEKDSDFSLALTRLAQLNLEFLNDVEKAKPYFERLKKIPSRLNQRNKLLTDAMYATAYLPATAYQRWQDLLQTYPDADQAHYRLGQIALWINHNPDAAVRHFNNAVNSAATRNAAQRALTIAYAMSGDTTAAAAALKKVTLDITSTASQNDPILQRVLTYLAIDDTSRAIQSIDQASLNNLPATLISLRLGEVKAYQGNYQDAAADFSRITSALPASENALDSYIMQRAKFNQAIIALGLADKKDVDASIATGQREQARKLLLAIINNPIKGNVDDSWVYSGNVDLQNALIGIIAWENRMPDIVDAAYSSLRSVLERPDDSPGRRLTQSFDCLKKHDEDIASAQMCIEALMTTNEYFLHRIVLHELHMRAGDLDSAAIQAQWLKVHQSQGLIELPDQASFMYVLTGIDRLYGAESAAL